MLKRAMLLLLLLYRSVASANKRRLGCSSLFPISQGVSIRKERKGLAPINLQRRPLQIQLKLLL